MATQDEYVTAMAEALAASGRARTVDSVPSSSTPRSAAPTPVSTADPVAAIREEIRAFDEAPGRQWTDEALEARHALFKRLWMAETGATSVADQMEGPDLRGDSQGVHEVEPEDPRAGLPEWAIRDREGTAVALVRQAPEHLQGDVRAVIQLAIQSYDHVAALSPEEIHEALRERWGAQYGDKLAWARYLFDHLPKTVREGFERERPNGLGQVRNIPDVLDAVAALGERVAHSEVPDDWIKRWQATMREQRPTI